MPETALLFLLAFTLGLILALFVRPMYGLYTYMAVFYLHPPSRWWGDALPDLRWALVSAAVTFIAILIHRAPAEDRPAWHDSTIVKVLILYTLWMWVQWPWVVSDSQGEGVVLFTKYLLLIYMMLTLLDNEQDFRGFCMAHILGCGYLGWLIYMAADGGRLDGVGGPGIDDASTLSMHLGTGLMFAAFMLLIAKSRQRWMVLLTIPLILNGIIQTETRGAIVGLVLGGLATLYLKPRRIRRLYYALSLLAVLSFVFIANEAFLARVETLGAVVNKEQEWDSSAQSRLEVIKSQFRMFTNHPLGVGHQGTATLSQDYLDERWLATNSGDRASHNTVMSILVDQGIPGIILFIVLAVAIAGMLRRLKKMDSEGLPDDLALYRAMLGGALLVYFGAGMFAQFLKAEILYWCLALLVILWRFSMSSLEFEQPSRHVGGEDGRTEDGVISNKRERQRGRRAAY